MKKYILALCLSLGCFSALAASTSTINPSVPAQSAPLTSATIRNNFAAAYNDINRIFQQLSSSSFLNPSGGALGSLQYNAGSGTFGGSVLSGDCTWAYSTGAITCLKSGGTAFGTMAFLSATDPTFIGTASATNFSAPGNFTGAAFVPTGSTLPTNGMFLSAANTVGFTAGSLKTLDLEPTTSQIDWLAVKGSTSSSGGVSLTAKGSGSNVPLNYVTKGQSKHVFKTRAGSAEQVVIDDAINAINAVSLMGGATGIGPTISVGGSAPDANSPLNIKTRGTTAQGINFFDAGARQFTVFGSSTATSYFNAGGGVNSTALSAQGGTNPTMTIYTVGSGGISFALDNTSTGVFDLQRGASGGDGATLTAQTAGSGPLLQAKGSGSNLPLTIQGKGTGNIVIGGHIQHIAGGTAAPSMGSCGTTPSVSGTDTRGVITTGTGAPTSCALNFGTTWGATPVCTISTSSTSVTAGINAISTTVLTINFSAGLTSGKVYYQCVQ